jgi:hypothetical protein
MASGLVCCTLPKITWSKSLGCDAALGDGGFAGVDRQVDGAHVLEPARECPEGRAFGGDDPDFFGHAEAALTDPTILSGIGNAYSDEILHRARLSPVTQTSARRRRGGSGSSTRLGHAHRRVDRAPARRGRRRLPERRSPRSATAWRSTDATASRAPTAAPLVQRIVYAENEANYCATLPDRRRLLADRSLSRLLKKDWPRTLDELEERRPALQRKPNPERSTKAKKPTGP